MQSSARRFAGVCVLLACGVVGCSKPAIPATSSEVSVTLQLNWRADAQHGGFYASKLNGHYKAAGLDVEILQGGPGTPVIPKLVMGRVDFAIANADQILQAREKDADIVAVLAPLQDSPRCIMVHESAGIDSLADLTGVTLAMNEGRTFAMFLKNKLPLTDVRIVSYSGTISKFVVDRNYAQQGYVFSEPLVARREGSDPKALMVSELGFNPYTSCIAVNRSSLNEAQQQDIVRKFVAASRRGWQDYLADPAATNAAIAAANPDMDVESLNEAAVSVRQLCQPDGLASEQLGQMTDQRWEQLTRQMAEMDFIADDTAAADAYQILTDE